MTKTLKVVSDFEPAGSQPEAISSLVGGLNDGLLHQVLLGVTGAGKTYTMAKVIEETQRPAIVMVHNKTQQHSYMVNLEISFQIIQLSILFLTMITTSQKPMYQHQILTLLRMLLSMSILSKCAFLQPKLS